MMRLRDTRMLATVLCFFVMRRANLLFRSVLVLLPAVLAGTTLSACDVGNCPSVAPGLRETTIAAEFDAVARDILATADGGAVVAGYVSGYLGLATEDEPGDYEQTLDAYVVKTDAAGSVVWETTMGGVDADEALDIVAAGDGGYLVLGSRGSLYGLPSGPRKPPTIFVAKLDGDGNVLWTVDPEVEPFTEATGIGVHDDGRFAIAAIAPGVEPDGSDDALVIGFGASGAELWRQRFTDDERVYRLELAASDGGAYAIAGAGASPFVVKIGAGGDIQWVYDGSALPEDGGITFPIGIVAARSGGFVIAGQSGGRVKLDEDGNLLWRGAVFQTPINFGFDLAEASDGALAVTGTSFNVNNTGVESCDHLHLVRLSENGAAFWSGKVGRKHVPARQGGLDFMADGKVVIASTIVEFQRLKIYLVVTDAGAGSR